LRLQLLHVATDLRIFDALSGERTLTSEQIAEQLNLNASRLQRLLLSLVSLGLLERHGDGKSETIHECSSNNKPSLTYKQEVFTLFILRCI
jgi:DNA-binding MarR family transcriptional regulator